jgi:cbb3-type cytochrome oxidase subunit 3
MSRSGLVGWAELGLLLFVAAFVGIVIYTFLRRNRAKFERASRLPLEDDDPAGRADEDRGEGR